MSEIEEYLNDLSARLKVGRKKRDEILEEVRDHLLQSVESLSAHESSSMDAESQAVTAFGPLTLIASQFNADAGAKATRRAPIIALTTGASVVAVFLLAVINQPKTTALANLPQQITFFLSVIAFQFALVAGVCGLSRSVATWKTSASSGTGRAYVKRCITVSMIALSIGTATMAANFIFDMHRGTPRSGMVLTVGASSMVLVAVIGLTSVIKLPVNSSSENLDLHSSHPRALFEIGESTINLVRRFPFLSSLFTVLAASAWVMAHAESSTFIGAFPWGIAEAISVIAGFLFLGRTLGLRPPLSGTEVFCSS